MFSVENPFTVTDYFVKNPEELVQALKAVASLRAAGAYQPVAIRLQPGKYFLKEPIVIDPSVSAVTIEPFGNGQVQVIGGLQITGFAPDTYNGHACLSAPIPLQADGSVPKFSDFYVNNARADYTRYPEEGYLYPTDVENHDTALNAGSHWFLAQPGDFPVGMKNPEQVIVSFCHFWVDEHSPIRSYDEGTGKVTMQYRSCFSIAGAKGTRSALEYYLENVAETFGKPNQWYADGGRIYYIPRDDSINAETMEAYLPLTHKLFIVEGQPESPVRGIRFRDLDMQVTKGDYASLGYTSTDPEGETYASDGQAVCNAGGSIHFKYAKDCAIEGGALHNFGIHGVCIEEGCSGIHLRGMNLYDGGAGGVKIYGKAFGCAPCEETYDCSVTDCRIDRCGRRYFAACGVLIMHAHHCVVEHCDIGNLYYSGISCGWVWGYTDNQAHHNRIAKNHIHHLGMGMLSDMGGVYVLGRQPGTVVSENLIHDVSSKNYGGWCLYLDEGASWVTMENNICYNGSDNVFHQHYGQSNTIRNNIFAFGGKAVVCLSRQEHHLQLLLEHNIYYSSGENFYEFGYFSEQPGPEELAMHNNLIWNAANAPILYQDLTLEQWQAMDFESGCIVADPCFADPENGDFTMPADSPAYAMGFRKIDLSDVGPRGC